MTCGSCVFLFPFVCLVCILKIFVPIVSSLQSLILGTRSVSLSGPPWDQQALLLWA